MWLMTQHGFYSIVQKKPGEYTIRSRERGDLQNLIDRVPLPTANIRDTPDNDYHFRLVGDHTMVQRVMKFLSETLDYDNFKDHISRTPDQQRKRKTYLEVWKTLAKGLGSYDQPGSEAD